MLTLPSPLSFLFDNWGSVYPPSCPNLHILNEHTAIYLSFKYQIKPFFFSVCIYMCIYVNIGWGSFLSRERFPLSVEKKWQLFAIGTNPISAVLRCEGEENTLYATDSQDNACCSWAEGFILRGSTSSSQSNKGWEGVHFNAVFRKVFKESGCTVVTTPAY